MLHDELPKQETNTLATRVRSSHAAWSGLALPVTRATDCELRKINDLAICDRIMCVPHMLPRGETNPH
jgi:hypothetical protein